MSFSQILKSALQKGIRRGDHNWLVRPLRELDTHWLFWRFPVMVAEEAPFAIGLLKYHFSENAKDRQYLELIYHSLADAPKNRDAAALASYTGNVCQTHPEMRWFRQVMSQYPKPDAVEKNVLKQIIRQDMPYSEEPEDLRYCRNVMFERLYQGGMQGDRRIILAALRLTLTRGVEDAVLRENLDDLHLRAAIPACALDMHTAEGKIVMETVHSRHPDIPHDRLAAIWFACRSGLVNEQQAPSYVSAETVSPGVRESLWHPLALHELAQEMGQPSPGHLYAYWQKHLLPDVERESEKALATALAIERERVEQAQKKPQQLKLC